MNGDRRKWVDEIFTRALELEGNARDEYLEQCCEDDEIRREVRRLLDTSTAPSHRFEQRYGDARERLLADVVASEGAPEEEDLTGQRAGHWRIDRRIARGGLATVYLAHRDDGEFDQAAAFKVLRRGLDTDDVVARFRAERQILSALDHPGIAQILDGGALPDGRPFLVLEYVDGVPITAYCEREHADVHDRVRLVMQVLQALQHAHRNLVVHRDIKPSNILVSSEGHVSLLDFGIAKLLDPEALPGASTNTRTGISLLTPGYGSPEQLAARPVTTASDLYQVGVVLYELLTGQRPAFGRDDNDSVTPSLLLKGDPAFAEVHGDLDAIVQKAMQADPARRYGSASELHADLERYLEGRPVVAQPDTLGYRLRKLLKRRPWLLPSAAILVLGITVYVVTLTLHSRQLRLEQQRAQAAQAFMVDLFRSPDPFAPADSERGRNITVVEALELGRRRLEDELADQPELRATLLGSLAGVYQSLDQDQEAIELGEQALALNLELYGGDTEAVLENLRLLADRYNARGDHERANAHSAKQLEIARATYDKDDFRLGLAEAASGIIALSQGDIEESKPLLDDAIRILRTDPAAHPEEFISAIIASTERHGMVDAAAALRVLEEALETAESAYGADSIHAARLRIAIGRNALYAHERERSEENYRYGLDILESKLGRNHGATITVLQDYGAAMLVTGDHAGAESVFRDLSERLVAQRGEMHRSVADIYQNLATSITYQGRYDESVPLHRKAYDIYRSVLEDDSYLIAFPLLSIASIEVERHRAPEAEKAAREALARVSAAIPGSYVEGVALCLLGLSLEQQGRVTEGSTMVEESHALILKRDVLVPKYLTMCRVPVPEAAAAESSG